MINIEDEQVRRKFNLIKNADAKIKDIKFSNLLALLNLEELDDRTLYDFLVNTKGIIFSYFDEEELHKLYDMAIAKNSNLLRKLGNVIISFRDFFGNFRRENNISNINNSDDYKRLYEIADLAFYSNKVTKSICLPCLNYLAQKNDIEELEQLYQMELLGNTDFWKIINEKSIDIQESYQMYRQIRRTENVCYAIKDASIRKMLDILYKDNYQRIKTWGFFKDNSGKTVFAIDFPYEFGGTFQFHIPDESISLSKFFSNNSNEYVFPFRDIVKNHPKHISIRNISRKTEEENMQILRNFKRNEDRPKYYFSIANNLNVFSIFSQREPSHIYPLENVKNFSSEELKMREAIIEQLRRYPRIALQYGNNLDINASIYAIQKFCIENGIIQNADELEIVTIGAGMYEQNAVNIDTGSLNGIRINDLIINANESLGEKSACAVLARLGFYVPKEIIKNADIIYGNNILNSRYGLVLARELKGEKLFDFAERKRRDTEEPLLTANLTNEEIEEFGLIDFFKKREKDIEEAKKIIEENTYILPNGNKIAIIPQFVNYGSFIAYSQGINYYCSIAEGKGEQGITFAITANPNTSDGKLPEELIKFGYALRSQYNIKESGSGVWVSSHYDKIIAGGPKNKDFCIYPNMNSANAMEQFIIDLKIKLGIEVEQELPNILSGINSLGTESRVATMSRMNYDFERKENMVNEGEVSNETK